MALSTLQRVTAIMLPRAIAMTVLTVGVLALLGQYVPRTNGRTWCTLIAVAAALLGGQVARREATLYPLVPWSMYTTARAPQHYYRFLIVTPTNGAIDYPMDLLAPLSPGPLSGYSMLNLLAAPQRTTVTTAGATSNISPAMRLRYR
jgi:hypothetical protein